MELLCQSRDIHVSLLRNEVLPKSKFPTRSRKKQHESTWMLGVWSYGSGTDQYDDNKLMPQDVIIHDDESIPKDFDDSPLHGMFGYAKGGMPDAEHLLFLSPGELPPDKSSFERQEACGRTHRLRKAHPDSRQMLLQSRPNCNTTKS
jgi:hypothetical protein